MTLMTLFYRAFSESTSRWRGNLGTKEKNAPARLVNTANKIEGVQFSRLNYKFIKQGLTKATAICSDSA